MLVAVRPVVPVLLAVVFMEGGLGILWPLVSLELARRDVPSDLIGLVTSAYFVGFLAGTLTGHRIIDRSGHIRAFAVFAALAANAVLAHLMFPDAIAWIALRAVLGYAFAGLFVIVESWLNDKATGETRGRIFAVYMAVSWAATGVSPLALNFEERIGTTILFGIVAMLLTTALVPMALTRVGNPEIGRREHFGIAKLFRISPSGVTACFGTGLVATAFYGLLPAYTEAIGLTTGQLAVIYSASTIAGLIIQYPVGMLSDHLGRRPLMVACAAGGAAIAASVALLEAPSFMILLALLFALEGIVAPLYALGVGQTNDYIERKDFVAASAGLLFAWGLGAAIGPTAAGVVMGRIGVSGLFWFVAAGLGLLAAFLLVRIAIRHAKSAREQGNYVAVPLTPGTYGAPELDPRAEPERHPHKLSDV
ncbi:MAG: MFS transporter [Alphaproteobacteria bacterium]